LSNTREAKRWFSLEETWAQVFWLLEEGRHDSSREHMRKEKTMDPGECRRAGTTLSGKKHNRK